MPLGMPKVPYLTPGDEDASWVDLYYRLFHQRLLFLGQEINEETSNQIVAMMVYLNLLNSDEDIYLFINSPGGGAFSGIAIFDTMQLIKAEVQTVCIGLAASMASIVLVGGQITKRLAFPHARVMIHEPRMNSYDAASGKCFEETMEFRIMYDSMLNIYSERTGNPSWRIYKDMDSDYYMSPEEARAYGLIDDIAESL
uniref:ATP-dependent Clp protease proteolytic subunit n=1 Tax=Vicia bungei TaxID=153952 RepID=A0A6M4ST18_9FABA|nr:ClpP [Vicia bungei]